MNPPSDQSEIIIGSGNVFQDLGLPHPEMRQLKSLLAIQIRELMEQEELTPAEATRRAQLEPDQMSAILRGRLADFTIEQLFQCLNGLGHSVEVRVSSQETRPEETRLTLVTA